VGYHHVKQIPDYLMLGGAYLIHFGESEKDVFVTVIAPTELRQECRAVKAKIIGTERSHTAFLVQRN
jgi:hypothetical protein